jgi:hypothetical protein
MQIMTETTPHTAAQREGFIDAGMVIATTAGAIRDQDMFDLVDRALTGGRTREVMLGLATLGSTLLHGSADAKGMSVLEAAAQIYGMAEDEAAGKDPE